MATAVKTTKRGLTQKMKNFCHAYAETGNATQAYLTAYNTTNSKIASVESNALLQRDDITEYLAEINRPIVNKITNERERKRQIIWERIERCLEKEDETAIARYMDILNKMDAEYVNINRNIGDGATELSGLDTDALRKLLDNGEQDD